MSIRFRISKTKKTVIRRQGYIRMKELKDVLGEGYMPSKFPKETLNFWELKDAKWWDGGKKVQGWKLRWGRKKSRNDH